MTEINYESLGQHIFQSSIDSWATGEPLSIQIKIFTINRIGDNYICKEGVDKNLTGVEFMYIYVGDDITPYNKLTEYLNRCECIEPDKWKEIFPKNPQVPIEIQQDFDTLQRKNKITKIRSQI